MTELLLICAFALLGVVFATVAARWVLGRPAGDTELVRAAALVSGGVVRYLRRQTVVTLALSALVGALVFLAYGIAYQTGSLSEVGAREHGTVTTIAFIVGAAFAAASSWVSSWTGRHAATRVAAGVRRSLDDSLQIAIRAGAVSGSVSLALALLGLGGLYLGIFLYAGALSDPGAALAKVPSIPLLLPGFVLGAALVALLSHLGGSVFAKVADLGAAVAGTLAGPLDDDADNPAMLADLVGDNVGDGAPRAAAVMAGSATESLAAMVLAARLYRDNPSLTSATALVLFPLVARTFSLLAAWFGVAVVRTDDTEVPMNALARGLHVTTLLFAVGAIGCAKWLLGEHWLAFGSCVVLGAVCSLAFLYAAQYFTEQRYRPVREIAEAGRGGPTLAVLRGFAVSTEGVIVLLLIVTGSLIGAHHVASGTGLEGGGLFGVALAIGGMLGSTPYVLALDSLGSIADCAGGIVDMTVANERPDVRARARLLDAVGTTARAFAKSLGSVVTAMTCVLLLAVFLGEVWATGDAPPSLDVASPRLYLGAVAGLLSLLVFIWAVLRRFLGAARDLVNEIRTQIGDSVDQGGEVARGSAVGALLGASGRGEGRAPDLRRVLTDPVQDAQLACVEIVSRASLRAMLGPLLLGLGLPLLTGVVLRLLSTEDSVSAPAEALVAFLMVATVAGSLGSLLFTNAGSAWDNAKKYIETGAHGGGEADNPTYVAAIIGDSIGDPLKGAIGPATQAWLLTLSALSLVFLPFFL
ncbi:MAG: sodium/proton-translocating pyrophosphatase [Polyangiaceae bacterium]